jgi:hypothetical protein
MILPRRWFPCMLLRTVALGGLALCAVAATAGTPEGSSSPRTKAPQADTSVGSVQAFIDAIASALGDRAAAEGFRGGTRIVVETARGIDPQKARATMTPRLRKALRGGPLEAADGPLRARVALSVEGGTVWAVVVVDGPGLDGPTTVVVQANADRELLSAFGASTRTAQGRFLLERIGAIEGTAGCPPLDATLVDGDGDPALDLAVLTRCGVDVFRLDDSARPERLAGPFALPARRWPRIALGWLTAVGTPPHRLWLSTSAGHALFLDLRTGEVQSAPPELVPLRGVVTRDGPLALRGRFGSPLLSLPLRTASGADVVVAGLPGRMRDLAVSPLGDAWFFVAEDGTLAERDDSGELWPLSPERVGDRIVVLDLDNDGAPEVLTTAAVAPGEADQLVLRHPAPDGSSSTVLMKSPLSGGSIVAIAVGHIDYDARTDLVVLEEAPDGAAWTLWRLRHVP